MAPRVPLRFRKVKKMPVSAYFKGHGSEVMANMVKKHGAKEGKSIFYATANKKKMKPGQGGLKRSKMSAGEQVKALRG